MCSQRVERCSPPYSYAIVSAFNLQHAWMTFENAHEWFLSNCKAYFFLMLYRLYSSYQTLLWGRGRDSRHVMLIWQELASHWMCTAQMWQCLMFAPVCRLWVTRSFRFPLSLPVAASNAEWESHWGWRFFFPPPLYSRSPHTVISKSNREKKKTACSSSSSDLPVLQCLHFLFENCRSMSAFWKRPGYRVRKRLYQRRADQLGISGAREELFRTPK